jgi:hypothetical protein
MSDLPTHPLLYEIAAAEYLPRDAILACAHCIPEVAPDLLAAIERAAEAPVTSQSELNLVYYGVPILAAAREPRLQAPLTRLLRLPDDTLDTLLGDDYVITVARFAIGAFDGDAQALYDLVCDADATEFVRMPMFGVIGYLTWLGRIPTETTREFLYRFDADRVIPAGDIGWNGWETAIELLGWREFVPLVEAAYADGRLDTGVSTLRHFKKGLAAAVAAAPDDGSRFKDDGYDYIEDVLKTIAFPAPSLAELDRAPASGLDYEWDDEPIDDPDEAKEMSHWAAAPGQRRNPLRHVGRNDPCPCGSGKKHKRCCLAA